MKIEVTFDLEVSAKYTKQEIFEWIYYKLGYSGSMLLGNRLCDVDLDPLHVDIKIQ